MDYIELLYDIMKKHGYKSITYQNISVPNGWFVECKLYKNLSDDRPVKGTGYDENVDIAAEKAAKVVYAELNRTHMFQSYSSSPMKKRTGNIDDLLPPRQKSINTIEYQNMKKLLDKELDDYMQQRY